MLNRYCYSVRLGISRHSIAFSQILRFSNTSNDGSASSEAEEDFQKSKPSIKTVHKIKKSKSSTPEAKTNENLKPENIRKKLLELKQKKERKKPKPSEVAAEEILKAVDSVVKDLQYNGISDERKTKNELIGKLIEYEKEKFEAATSAQYSELLSDKDFATFLESLKDETVRPPPRAVEKRRMRQGLLLLKREIFYQALQSGHKAEDARRIAERAVTIAEERAIGKHEVLVQNYVEKQEKNILKEIEQTEKENTFYNIALQLARIWNQSFGPTNAFEEMIELTEQGKMWPYPIDNEYQIGEEEDVNFYDHIFLDKYLAQYDLPEEGPVAQFMELVCVGLSKNPYMSIKKKHAHLNWFANYFKEKAGEIKRIQESAGVIAEVSI